MSGLPILACPVCHAEYGLEVALGQDDARGVVRELARCPGDAATRKALLRYCALFSPEKQRLRWSRVEALLAEINDWMEAGRIERNGRLWAAPAAAFLHAIEAIEAKPDLRRPLKGHGLLLEIIASQSNSAEAKSERQREDSLAGRTPVGGVPSSPSSTPFMPGTGVSQAVDRNAQPRRAGMPRHVREAIQHLKPPSISESS